jgi:hypothetical protein
MCGDMYFRYYNPFDVYMVVEDPDVDDEDKDAWVAEQFNPTPRNFAREWGVEGEEDDGVPF